MLCLIDCNSEPLRKFKEYAELSSWLKSESKFCLNHNSKKHMFEDLARYLYTSLWTDAMQQNLRNIHDEKSCSPKTKFFPRSFASRHASWYSNTKIDLDVIHLIIEQKTITAHMRPTGMLIYITILCSVVLCQLEKLQITDFPR